MVVSSPGPGMPGTPTFSENRILPWVLVLVLGLPVPPARGQEPWGADPVASGAILDLQSAPDPDARREAASILSTIGSPAAVQALQGALSGDSDPGVRASAAEALGRLGPLARAAVPGLIRALEDLESSPHGDRATVCSAAASALGGLGRYALDAIAPLARAGTEACGGNPPAVPGALSLMARDLARVSSSLPSSDLEMALGAFEEARTTLDSSFPPGAGQSLLQLRREIRARRLGWLAPAARAALGAGGAILSLLGHLRGLLVAFLVIALVLLALRHSGRILPRLGIPVAPAGWKGVLILGPWKRSTPAWKETGSSRGFDARGAPREEESPPPKGSRVNVTLGEIRQRYQPAPGGPTRERVERVVQALAWTLMEEGRLEGWISLDGFQDPRGEPELEVVLGYLQEPLKVAEWNPRENRLRLSATEEETAQLGSLHLLKERRAQPQEILAHLGSLDRALSKGRARKRKAGFLRILASSLLDMADELEADGSDLGIAEEALVALAGPEKMRSRRGGDPGPARTPIQETGSRSSQDWSPKMDDGLHPDPGARFQRLLSRLQSEDHPAVRERIITTMGGMGPQARKALPILMASVEKDPPGVALAALDTLGRIGPGAEAAAPVLLRTLEHGSPSHRLAATRALGRLGDAGDGAAPTLLSWISREGIPHELRAGAAEALGGMPGQAEAAIPPLLELLRSPVATEVRTAAALALGKLDPGRKDVEEALARAREVPDPALQGMVAVAVFVRNQRLGGPGRESKDVDPAQWAIPMAITGAVLAVLQLGAVVGSEFLSPGTILPALFVGPVMAFLGGIAYAVATRRLPLNPTLGSGVTGWGGASLGLLMGFMVSAALSPLTLVIGGGLALGSGAFGGALVYTAVSEL